MYLDNIYIRKFQINHFQTVFLWQQVGFSGKDLNVYNINKITIENLTKTYYECEKS